MGSPQAPVRACGGGGRGDGGDGGDGGGGELADSPSTHSSGREPPVKFGKMRMFSRLPRGLIDSYATSAASSFVALLCRDVDEDQENLFSKRVIACLWECRIPYIESIYSVYRCDVKGLLDR